MIKYFEDELICCLDDVLHRHPCVYDSAKEDISRERAFIRIAGLFSSFKYWGCKGWLLAPTWLDILPVQAG